MPVMGPPSATDEQVEALYSQFIDLLHKNNIQRHKPLKMWVKHREHTNTKLKELVRELITQENYECF
jgi:hypothetical protein